MRNQYDKQLKEDAVKYYYEHKDLGLVKCAEKLGTSKTALATWVKAANETGEVATRSTDNYVNNETQKLARVKRELRDTHTLEILKKQSAFWEANTSLFY